MEQKQKQTGKRDQSDQATDTPTVDERALDESTDDILADIDDVLEENAEEFVQGYVQQGGQ